MAFTYTITHKAAYSVLSIKGRIIEGNLADEMIADINHHLYDQHVYYVLMLNDVESVQNSGLSVLIKLLAIIRSLGGNIVLTTLPESITSSDDGNKLKMLFQVYENEFLAAASLLQVA